MEEKLPNSFYEASITLIPKLDKPHQKGELQTNIPDEHGCQNSHKDTTSTIQEYIKRIIHHDQARFIPGLQGQSTFTNQLT